MTSASANTRRGGSDAPSLRWLVLTSLWLVFVLLPNGVTTWLGFAIVGFAVVRPVWLVASVAYFFSSVAINEASDELGAWSVILGGALWILGIAHGVAANRRWQTILWSRTEREVRLFGRGTVTSRRTTSSSDGRSSRSVPAEAVGLLDAAGTNRSDYLADHPADSSRSVSQRRPSSPTTRPERALPSTPVDVNTATQKALQALPGFTRQRARAVLRERDRLGGFSSVEQFATVAGLQPHELVRLTPALECSPKPRRPRSFGRRVDL